MFKNRVLSFIFLTYLITILYSLLYLFFSYNIYKNKIITVLITSVYMFIPLLSSVILQKIIYRENLKNIGINFKWSNWYLFSVFVPFGWSLLAFFIALLFPDISFSPNMSGMLERYEKSFTSEQLKLMREQIERVPSVVFFLGTILQMIIFGVTLNTFIAFGEEAGWRGFLLGNLKSQGFYYSSFITGLIWGIWHLPLIVHGHNYPEHKIAGVFLMIIWTILLSPFFTFVVYKTGTVLSAAIMHGVLNASYGLSIMYIKGGNDLTAGLTGVCGIIALIISNILLFFYIKYFEKDLLYKNYEICFFTENSVNIDKNNKT